MARIRIWNPYPRSEGHDSRTRYTYSAGGDTQAQKGGAHMAHRKYRLHHHRHHRNPLGFDKATITFAAWGVAGGAAALWAPAQFLSAQNNGAMGYAFNVGAAIAVKFIGDAVLGKSAGDAMFTGGLVATGLRILRDKASTIPGLGAYWQSYFALPTVSDPYGRVSASPYPAPALPAAAAGGRGIGAYARSAGRFGTGRFNLMR